MENNQKQEGGTCPDCGGKYIKNPRTGKIFCGNKCWLNNGQPLQEDKSQNQEDEKWERINARKEQSMNWLNAKRGSAELVSALIISKMLPMPTEDALTHYAKFFFEMEPPTDEKEAEDNEEPMKEGDEITIDDIPF